MTCELINVLYTPQIQDLKDQKEWPSAFEKDPKEEEEELAKKNAKSQFSQNINPEHFTDDSDSDGSLEGNVNQLNRPVVFLSEGSSDESVEEDDSG